MIILVKEEANNYIYYYSHVYSDHSPDLAPITSELWTKYYLQPNQQTLQKSAFYFF